MQERRNLLAHWMRSRWIAVVGLAGVAVAVAAIRWAAPTGMGVFRGGTSGGRDVYSDTPYQNARPGVAFVGDAACTGCHREIAVSYRLHPMGRSLAAIIDGKDGPPISATAGLPFESQGLEYSVRVDGGRVFHRATRRDSEGRVLGETEADVRFALGSGTRGTSFLIERDGLLFQSPIAWFAQEGRWGVSPGFGDANPRPNFERPIQKECLYCHTNRVSHVAGTVNRYTQPILEGHSIGCERCHGPGELHVNRPGAAKEADFTIVNPAKLAPALRDSVCQQCHLQGWFRFPRAGREIDDFRPGLPLHRFLAVFVKTKESRERLELIGQVEQMESSRCFRESEGKLGCISCHDPHRRPEASAKVAYFRKRCLECHAERGCAVPVAERQQREQGDDCAGCHMPRSNVSNIPHLAETNHRIPREIRGKAAEVAREGPGLPAELLPRDFHYELMDADERREGAREMGVALESVARLMRGAPRLAKIAATQALPLLEPAVANHSGDLTARDSLGYSFETLGRWSDARRVYEEILGRVPGREATLHSVARVLARDRRPDLAELPLRRTIAIDPWRSDYRLALANICFQQAHWIQAIAACRDAIGINPELYEARALLVQCYLRLEESQKADAEFALLLRFSPANQPMWQRWYAEQKQALARGARSLSIPKR